MKSFGTAKASLLIQKKKQNNQQPPTPWSLVHGLCVVLPAHLLMCHGPLEVVGDHLSKAKR